jgi:NAD-dependent DNA ligase
MKTLESRIFRDSGAPSSAINRKRRRDRATDELIGLCKGLLADGHLQDVEAKFLVDWLHSHSEFAAEYPFNTLVDKIEHALLHGVLDHEEEKDIVDVMLRLSGNPQASIAAASSPMSTSLPLDAPPPPIFFEARLFVVTGVFHFGSRRHVVEAIESRGGSVATSVSKKVNFLVVGNLGSEDWMHSSFGRKIERAIELRRECSTLAIINEDHWATALTAV